MSDITDPALEIAAIAACLRSMPGQNPNAGRVPIPAPARNPWAVELHSLGLRVHPELATKELRVDDAQAKLGPHATGELADITREDAKAMLNDISPEMAAAVAEAETDPSKAEQLKEIQRANLARLREQLGPTLHNPGQ